MLLFTSLAISFSKGLLLAGSVYALGWCMDRTISKTSHEKIIKKDENTYIIGQEYIVTNLLVISPIAYTIVDQLLLNHDNTFSILSFLSITVIENIGYYIIHREMHTNYNIRWIHTFHHKYDSLTIPSIANAVSYYEFLLAYIFPMVVGAVLIKPTESEFSCSIAAISIFNLLIHTYELNHVRWCPGFVSPTHHIQHHKERNIHYAAPLLNVDEYLYYVSQNILKQK
jgi:sterol desaturase/sphingolipid hydroxylase (fatty acid hydroxylase superfamily)